MKVPDCVDFRISDPPNRWGGGQPSPAQPSPAQSQPSQERVMIFFSQAGWSLTSHDFFRRAGLGRSSHGELLASQNSSFSTGFIRFLDVAECHVVYSENLMLFDHFGGLFAFRAPKSSKFDRFYKVFRSTFLVASKLCFTNGFLMFCKVVKRHQLLVENLMLS